MKFAPGSTPLKACFGILLSKDTGQSQIDNSALQRDGDGVGPVIGSQFGENVPDVALNGYLCQREQYSNLFICIAGGNQTEDVNLSRSQRIVGGMFRNL